VIHLETVTSAVRDLWQPFLTLGSIMVMTHIATELGVLELWARRASRWAHTTRRAFGATFFFGVVTSTLLNNDAAILLLVPLVLAMVKRRFADPARMAVPFAFAVFMAAGVAPFPVANPMNMVVASFAGISFNAYAGVMVPIAVCVWLISFVLVSFWFRADLAVPIGEPTSPPMEVTRSRLAVMTILGLVLAAYALVSYLGGPLWIVAAAGAALAAAVARAAGRPVLPLVVRGVSWQTLAFLGGVILLALGLKNQGLVGHLAGLFAKTSATEVGILSAVGSALLNNHPMAYLNMLALTEAARDQTYFLASLVGGDLGPRLLPIGSLAGLLWLERLHREGVEISLGTFVKVGAFVGIPSLAAALGVLAALSSSS
jgi:arsenical pump membrane protein